MSHCAKVINCLHLFVITKHWKASFVFKFIWKFSRSTDNRFLKFISIRYRRVSQVYRSCVLDSYCLRNWSLFLADSWWCSCSWLAGFIDNLCLATECLAQIIRHIWKFDLLLIYITKSLHSWIEWLHRFLMVWEHDIVQI